MAKSKAGKKSKPQSAPIAAPPSEGQPAGAHLDAPSAVAHPGADQPSSTAAAPSDQRAALVSKAGDRIPVQVKDDAHLERLIAEHGAGNVEVQS